MSRVLDLWSGMAGVVLPFAGPNEPTGWLFCFGQAVSRTTYANLFAVLGTTYGAGDGSTTFNLPDLRGRVAAGRDNMGGTAANRITNSGLGNPGINGSTLGASGGVDRHTLTAAQMPEHQHNIQSWIQTQFDNTGGANVPGGDSGLGGAQQSNSAVQTMLAGSGAAHPNTQPTIVLNCIIKT